MKKALRKKPYVDANSINSFEDVPRGVFITFIGLIAANSSGGGSSDGKNRWTYSINLEAFRVPGGPIVRERVLVVCRDISERKLGDLMKQASPLDILEFIGQRPASTRKPKTYPQYEQFELQKFIGKKRNAGLQEIRKELSKSVVVEDATFGTLTLNRQFDWFEGSASFRGTDMNVTFETNDTNKLQDLIRKAKPLWKKRQAWFTHWRGETWSYYSENLSHWYEGDAPLTRELFMRLLGWPVGVEFYEDAEEGFGYRLGGWSEDLVTDHGIDAHGRTIDGPMDVSL